MKTTQKKSAKSPRLAAAKRKFDALPDTVDFRDKMYVPTLVEVPTHISLATYKSRYGGKRVPILDQGQEGACTGFGLAAVVNYLLSRRKVLPDPTLVSSRMLYEMARRYDEWPGINYSGSSARGAMKGWHKHGVCSAENWPYLADNKDGTLNNARATDAAMRPLGAYFRVNHRELVAMHTALAEVEVLFATATVHEGWDEVGADGLIPFTDVPQGGHAFAIVGYDHIGFWIQNSWGPTWGLDGFARITYDDWLTNGTDVWVARLGAPVQMLGAGAKISPATMTARSAYSFTDLRPHIISIGNDGMLRPTGQFGTTADDVKAIFHDDLPRITRGWKKKRLFLYAHGGLVGEEGALQRVEEYRRPLLAAEVYPLAFVWKTDLWSTLSNILKDAMARRKPEGFIDGLKDFMLDRIDDTLELIARPLGYPLWAEMKENAFLSTASQLGGARQVLAQIEELIGQDPSWEIHIAGHSAGSIFMAPVVQMLCAKGPLPGGQWNGQVGLGRSIRSLTLWAPACTMKLFHGSYLPYITDETIERFTLFTLTDAVEQDDDCAKIYHKSVLYLVSNALEEKSGLLFAKGEPLLGMEKFIVKDRGLFQVPDKKELQNTNPAKLPLFGLTTSEWVRSPNSLPAGESADASGARHHGDFDDDDATVKSTLARILGHASAKPQLDFSSSAASLRDRRRQLSLIERR